MRAPGPEKGKGACAQLNVVGLKLDWTIGLHSSKHFSLLLWESQEEECSR